jgi:SAM-dependent methyltransferase
LARQYGLQRLFNGFADESNLVGVKYLPGTPAETFFTSSEGVFDFIVSRAVLEHLADPLDALDRMYDSLRPGGVMVHRIDLRDHGMFPRHHPLTFLTIPTFVYHRMVSQSGRPNRVLAHRYRRWLAGRGAVGSIRISRVVGESRELVPEVWSDLAERTRADAFAHVECIRDRLREEFRVLPAEDLATSGIVLVVRKQPVAPGLRGTQLLDGSRSSQVARLSASG